MIFLSKKKKAVIIVLLSFLVTLFSILFVTRMISPKEIETEHIIYEYDFNGGLNYQVYLRPNDIYEKNYLESDNQYIMQLTDYINLTYHLKFSSTNTSDITYNYTLYPSIESFTGNGESKSLLWKKNYSEISSIRNETQNRSFSEGNEIKIYLEDYVTFTNEVYDNLDINTNDYLVLYFEGDILIDYEGNFTSEEFSQSIKIPLMQKVFSIEDDDNFEVTDMFMEYNKDLKSVNIVSIIGFVISTILIILSIKFIKLLPPISIKEKTSNKIFNEYSDRLVQLTSSTYDFNELIYVNEFNDILKIADEISQPIFYQEKVTNEVNFLHFLVFDSNKNYCYILE